ncbi:43096_t:CDS:2 [Gigaspora margarita]|uniref:43096_t:CDS:1 n=1 Tax=Gigaspora margarita TaxID=4874 RepID=A0ABM8W1B3_GIGMA|nr:43096_t:CDS:2 [Gigaspora margarita]
MAYLFASVRVCVILVELLPLFVRVVGVPLWSYCQCGAFIVVCGTVSVILWNSFCIVSLWVFYNNVA